jgi:hypothetical protein
VNPGQQSIPVPPEPESGLCGWCGATTREKITLTRGGLQTQANGSKVRQPDRWSWVCADHRKALTR